MQVLIVSPQIVVIERIVPILPSVLIMLAVIVLEQGMAIV